MSELEMNIGQKNSMESIIRPEHKDWVFYPMKPSACFQLPKDLENYVIEPKANGWHCLFVVNEDKLGIYSRNLKVDLTDWRGLEQIRKDFECYVGPQPVVFLAELVNFEKPSPSATARLATSGKGIANIFDIICSETIQLSLEERRKYLQKYNPTTFMPQIKLNNNSNIKMWFKYFIDCYNAEGIVLKKKSSLYYISTNIGIKTPDWLKIK